MQLSAIDLNLAVILHALIETRSITAAAKRVGLSQSATSHALARLRELLADPLLVRVGRGVIPTPRALEIAAGLASGLAQLERALFSKQTFDPMIEKRTFRLIAGDFTELLLIPELIARLSVAAPLIDVWFESPDDNQFERLATGSVDALIGIAPRVGEERKGLKYQKLLTDQFVSIVRKGHPMVKQGVTLKRFAEHTHAFVAPGARPGGVVDRQLAALGLSRRVALAVPHFLVAPHVVAKTDLVLTIGSRLAQAFVGLLPLAIIKPPLKLPSFELGLYWHVRNHDDPAHQFLRHTLGEIAATVTQMPAAAKTKTRRKVHR